MFWHGIGFAAFAHSFDTFVFPLLQAGNMSLIAFTFLNGVCLLVQKYVDCCQSNTDTTYNANDTHGQDA